MPMPHPGLLHPTRDHPGMHLPSDMTGQVFRCQRPEILIALLHTPQHRALKLLAISTVRMPLAFGMLQPRRPTVDTTPDPRRLPISQLQQLLPLPPALGCRLSLVPSTSARLSSLLLNPVLSNLTLSSRRHSRMGHFYCGLKSIVASRGHF